jgi:D-alanyl-D-alanine carboxypeptidase
MPSNVPCKSARLRAGRLQNRTAGFNHRPPGGGGRRRDRLSAVIRAIATVAALVGFVLPAARVGAQIDVGRDLAREVDRIVGDVLARTGVPSASVGIVRDGGVVLTKAYGRARLEPSLPATAEMRYPVGSISKQFTAACVLLLQQDGKLSIDDPVGKYFPELTRASDVLIRNILSHTSGYEDYAPQDYTIPAWTKPTTASEIVHEWATKPLDFEPGAEYQYSNTNFNIAGLVVEKVAGEPFWRFLERRVLTPLKMTRTIDLDTSYDKVEPVGYMRNALGPLRPARIEAPGWYFADGEMAMPVADLLTWDISMMNESLLAPASYRAMETDTRLSNGLTAGYGLGVSVSKRRGHRIVAHDGEVGGFVAANTIYPDDRIAIAVLTNQEASSAAGAIARQISEAIFRDEMRSAGNNGGAGAAEVQAKQIIGGLQHGSIDRGLFTTNANFYFDADAIADFKSSLSPLGGVKSVEQTSSSLRGGMTFRSFDVLFANGTRLRLTTYTTADGKLEQFLLESPA